MVAWADVASHFTEDANSGLLIDIFIEHTRLEDWHGVLTLLNTRSEWAWGYLEDGEPADLPANLSSAFDRSGDHTCLIALHVAGALVHCFLNSPHELEFDVSPRDVRADEQFEALLDFVTSIGRAVGKPVHVAHEGMHERPFLIYEPEGDVMITGSPSTP